MTSLILMSGLKTDINVLNSMASGAATRLEILNPQLGVGVHGIPTGAKYFVAYLSSRSWAQAIMDGVIVAGAYGRAESSCNTSATFTIPIWSGAKQVQITAGALTAWIY